jgi:hypothetical protein
MNTTGYKVIAGVYRASSFLEQGTDELKVIDSAIVAAALLPMSGWKPLFALLGPLSLSLL